MIDNLLFPLDFILLTISIIVLILCFWKGIIASILSLLTWFGSILITIYFYIDLSEFFYNQLLKIKIFKNYEQITDLISTFISIPIIFLISLFILKRIRKIISNDIDKQILGVIIDKIFGLIFGFAFNYIIFSTIIYCTDNFEILNFLNNWMSDNSYLLSSIEKFNYNLIDSIIGEQE